MGRVSLDGREGEGQQMTLLAVEVAVALFQQYAMSSAEECVPCSPGRVTELITRRARGGDRGGWGQETFPGVAGGLPSPSTAPAPWQEEEEKPSPCMRCVQRQRGPVPVWSRGGCVCGPAKPCSSVQRLLTAC